MQSTHEVGTVEGNEQKSIIDEGPYQIEETQFINRSYKFKPNTNLPTHYTLALRNHENFSYGSGAHQGQRSV